MNLYKQATNMPEQKKFMIVRRLKVNTSAHSWFYGRFDRSLVCNDALCVVMNKEAYANTSLLSFIGTHQLSSLGPPFGSKQAHGRLAQAIIHIPTCGHSHSALYAFRLHAGLKNRQGKDRDRSRGMAHFILFLLELRHLPYALLAGHHRYFG